METPNLDFGKSSYAAPPTFCARVFHRVDKLRHLSANWRFLHTTQNAQNCEFPPFFLCKNENGTGLAWPLLRAACQNEGRLSDNAPPRVVNSGQQAAVWQKITNLHKETNNNV